MKQYYKTLFFIFLVNGLAVAQSTDSLSVVETTDRGQTAYDETKILYRQEKYGGIFLHTRQNGGLNYRDSKHLTALKRRLWSLEISALKHQKEHKTSNPFFDEARQYVFGKKNELVVLRPSYGREKILYTKEVKRGVQIGMVYLFGPTIGFLKPVYLEIRNTTPSSGDRIVISTEKYDETKHFPEKIYGRAPYLKGVDELQIMPGIHTKFGFKFDYSSSDEKVRAIEVGANLDVFYKSVPIMAITKNDQVFLTFYANLLFGKRTFY